jgi:predicted dehydrogenase
MSNKVRVGLVGIRNWAIDVHLHQLLSHPGARVVAICGRDLKQAEQVAAQHGIPRAFGDYHAMIDQGGLDAVVISTPDDTHYPITLAALEKGLHVVCEKPLAMSAAQAREMRDRAVAAGVVHMPFFTFRWIPAFQRMKRLVAEGYIGRVLSCEFHFLEGIGQPDHYAWRFDPRHSQGVLADRGSHMIDLARWLVGDISRVHAHLVTFQTYPGPDGKPMDPVGDDAWVMLEFAGGASGVVHTSWVTYQAERNIEQRVTLYGDQGMLEVDNPIAFPASPGTTLRGARYGEQPVKDLPVSDDPKREAEYHQGMLAYAFDAFAREPVGDRLFIDRILAGQPVSPDFTDGLKAQEVIEAAFKSQQDGGWVEV